MTKAPKLDGETHFLADPPRWNSIIRLRMLLINLIIGVCKAAPSKAIESESILVIVD